MHYRINASFLNGHITIPPSKSHTLRAILFASLAKGESTIYNYLHSPDTTVMINACRQLGAEIDIDVNKLHIVGTAGKPQLPANVIDAGNSGQVLRFISAIAALIPGYTILTGDHSIRTNRPIQPLLDGLQKLNVFAVSTKDDGYAPVIIKGPLQPGKTFLHGEDSQPVSGLLIAAAFSQGPTFIQVKNPGEKTWIDLTLDWFERLGIAYEQSNYTDYIIPGGASYAGFEYTVPGDFSSAAFPIVAALITNSEIILHNLDMNDVQGDKKLITILQKMGAQIDINHKQKILHVKKSVKFTGEEIDVNDFVDAVTILAVMACFAEGETRITGAEISRKKESDRLTVITQELQKMGARITATADGLIIQPSQLTGTEVHSHDDHRIAMSLAVAALAAKGKTIIEKVACVAKSYPNFSNAMQELGAAIEVVL